MGTLDNGLKREYLRLTAENARLRSFLGIIRNHFDDDAGRFMTVKIDAILRGESVENAMAAENE